MADERTTALRDMAAHQGFTLRASRRRKPGGDFGKFGLVDAGGVAAMGVGSAGLEATADEVEAFLRTRTRNSWASSTKGLKRTKAPPPRPEPTPEPKFRPLVANLFARLPLTQRGDAALQPFAAGGVRIERVVASTDGKPLVEDHDIWVLLLSGEADLRIEDSAGVPLKPGDHVAITRGQEYRITGSSGTPGVLLRVHVA